MAITWIVRCGMAGLAAVHLWWGGWATGWPQHFFDNFPGLGWRWTAGYPPYNEHLVADLGATFLTIGVLLTIAAALHDAKVTAVALVVTALFGALHLWFHFSDTGEMTGTDLGLSLAALVGGVFMPLALLGLDVAGRRSSRR